MVNQGEYPQKNRFIRFFISNRSFCVRLSWVRRIRNAYELISDWDLESDNGSNIIYDSIDECPIIKLNEIAEYSNSHNIYKKILILNLGEKCFGILVDTVEDIFDALSDQIFDIPHFVGEKAIKYFDEIVYYKENLMLVCSPLMIYKNTLEGEHSISDSIMICHEAYGQSDLSIAYHRQKKIVIFTPDNQGGLLYGLSITQVPQILQRSSTLFMPGSADYIHGVVEWRSMILPVIDISFCVEKKRSNIDGECRMVIVRLISRPIYIAIVAQDQILIQSFPLSDDLFGYHSGLNLEYAIEKFLYKNQTLVIPDIDRIVVSSK